MRLHRLALQAIGPYADRQEIDFDRLAQSQLFLLEGPTGAGKSTILDAITFALYGALAGRESDSDRLHSHFADPGTVPEVTLEFSVNGRRHRVTRSPEYERAKRRGEGTTTEKASVHLERFEPEGWKSLTDKVNEAGVLLGQALGLSRQQFTQVVLLPQGEFATFLQADDDQRRAVLTRLFGTELYDRVTQFLHEERRAAGAAVSAASRGRGEALAAAREAAGQNDPSGQDEAVETGDTTAADADAADADAYVHATKASLAARQVAAQADVDAARDALLAAQAHRTEAIAAAERSERLRAAQASLADHRQTRETRTAWDRERAEARAAAAVRPLIDQASQARDAVAEAHALMLTQIAEPADAEDRGEGAGARREAAAKARAEAVALDPFVAREEALLDRQERAAQAAQEAQDAATVLVERAELQERLPHQLATARGDHLQAQHAAAGLAGDRQRAEALRTQHEAAVRAERRAAELAAAESARQLARDAHHQTVDEHQRIQDARLAGIAAELAGALRPGEPCSVCGAIDHPAPAQPGPAAVGANAVQAAAGQRDAAEAARAQAEERHRELLDAQQRDLVLADGRPAGALRSELDDALRLVADTEAVAQRLDEHAARVAALEVAQAQGAQDVLALTTAAATARAQADQAALGLAAEEAELATARGGLPSVRARRDASIAQAERDEAAADALAALAQAHAAWTTRLAQARAESVAAGFDDAETARQALRDPQDHEQLTASIEAWDAQDVLRAAAAADPELAASDPQQAGALRAAAATAEREAAAAFGCWEAAGKVQQTADERASRFTARAEDFLAADAVLTGARAAARPLERLAGLTKGTDGHRRVALTTYVLRLWFEKVVQAANGRLQGMSAGRYSLERVDEGSTARERSGLTLRVVDAHTGQSRSEKSLSGGETFYTSLALALGVADVVTAEAGGITLDTLFIDEGFGSLDTQTLDQVMGVIDALREGGRTVGIVSHVAELKDRVAERLTVSRSAEGGPSTVAIVA